MVHYWCERHDLEPFAATWARQRLFDRAEIERFLSDRLAGEELDAARRTLVRLALGELCVKGGELRQSGVYATTGDLLDEEVLGLIAEAALQTGNVELARVDYDKWAAARGAPVGDDLMLRLGVFSWPALRRRAVAS